MPSTTSCLKDLAETRARAEADYQNALESAAHLTAHLQRLFANFESKSNLSASETSGVTS